MSERERKGFLVLSVLIGFIAIVPVLYSFYLRKGEQEAIVVINRSIVHKAVSLPEREERRYTGENTQIQRAKKEVQLFSFDPNNLPAEQWEQLGFTEKQVQVIQNYQAKGGRFRTKADVAKLYVVSEADFERIAPYISLPDMLPAREKVVSAEKTADRTDRRIETLRIDLATADTLSLQRMQGIGPVLASRIVKFREALGGFHSLAQVKEVYGISAEQYAKMEPSLILGDNPVQKLPVNALTEETLAQHPYISWKEARHIVRYREQHGAFTALTDLEKMHALDEEFIRKIGPYLDFVTRD